MDRISRMYEALRRISKDYQSSEQLRRASEEEWGLSYEEALEMAYENIQNEARMAIKGMRRPNVERKSPKATRKVISSNEPGYPHNEQEAERRAGEAG